MRFGMNRVERCTPDRTCTVHSERRAAHCGDQYPTRTLGQQRMISIAVQGYGIVIWDDDGEWRTFAASDSLSAVLATRVEMALDELPRPIDSEDAVCSALLSIEGAHLLAVGCDHRPGECDDEVDRN